MLPRRGVDLAAWLDDEWGVVRKLGGELRFRPGDGPRDPSRRSWELEGNPEALDLTLCGESLQYGDYPDALERLWGFLHSERGGDLVLSATPGYTFGEVSGGYHTAGDHGSLHASDSNVFVLASGIPAPCRITDVAPTLLEHFGADESVDMSREPHVL